MRRLLPLLLVTLAVADPCGMVPPIFTGDGPPITRIGLQQTYVFFKDGVESIAIRPGFAGKVEDFGMLIPFPSPPALRKLPDDIFGHLAAAVDPPPVIERLWDDELRQSATLESVRDGHSLGVNSVAVLREEAVGMYEIAVLQAGSADALARWMDEHGYVYPEGMDGPCQDYVELGWCFVAVKTRVGPKSAVDPAPGARRTAPGLPVGSAFDGHVQAMGFRFRTPELVVPMRLSAFNEGALRNVIYLLTDGPRKLVGLPAELVRRQLSGQQLLGNLRDLRPLIVVGGEVDELSLARWKQLLRNREPGPVNGLARELFASDLRALAEGTLSLALEEREKELLHIGEQLGLRGEALDALHRDILQEAREEALSEALDELEGLTLTVFDGDFPREHLATTNLTFEPYTLPAAKNTPREYDAVAHRATEGRGEPVEDAALPAEFRELLPERSKDEQNQSAAPTGNGWLALLPIAAVLVLLVLLRRPRGPVGKATNERTS